MICSTVCFCLAILPSFFESQFNIHLGPICWGQVTYGIAVLAIATGFLLILFGGVTDRLIPLYAVGAFLAFTLSQAGMVRHWAKKRGPHWLRNVFINGLGALVTGITVLVVLVAKFRSGAWITVIFIPMLIFFFRVVRRHYHAVTLATWS